MPQNTTSIEMIMLDWRVFFSRSRNSKTSAAAPRRTALFWRLQTRTSTSLRTSDNAKVGVITASVRRARAKPSRRHIGYWLTVAGLSIEMSVTFNLPKSLSVRTHTHDCTHGHGNWCYSGSSCLINYPPRAGYRGYPRGNRGRVGD